MLCILVQVGLQSPAPGVSTWPVWPIRVLHLPGYSEVYFFKLRFTSGSFGSTIGKERFTFHWDCCWGTKPTQKEAEWRVKRRISDDIIEPLGPFARSPFGLLFQLYETINFYSFVSWLQRKDSWLIQTGVLVYRWGPRGLRWSKAGVGVGVN